MASEKPATAPKLKQIYGHSCFGCGKVVENRKDLLACSKCNCAYYCSAKCQRESWKGTAKYLPANSDAMDRRSQGHKYWCFDPSGADEKAVRMVLFLSDPKEGSDNPLFLLSESAYENAVGKYDLHSAILREIRHDIEDIRDMVRNGLHGNSDDILGVMICTSTIFKIFFSGSITATVHGKHYFLRMISPTKEERCIDERRFVAFITSTNNAWDTLMEGVAEVVMFRYHDLCKLRIFGEAKMEHAGVFFEFMILALSTDSVARIVLEHYARSTLKRLTIAINALLDKREHIRARNREAVVVLGQSAFALLAVLREQAKRLKGREWADEHVCLDGIMSVLSNGKNGDEFSEDSYTVARSMALQFICCSGKSCQLSQSKSYLSWCKKSKDSI